MGIDGNEGVADRIQQLVTGLLNDPDRSMGLRVLGLLQRLPVEQWNSAELLQAADRLDSYHGASVADRLMMASLRIHNQPRQGASLMEQAKTDFEGDHPEIVTAP